MMFWVRVPLCSPGCPQTPGAKWSSCLSLLNSWAYRCMIQGLAPCVIDSPVTLILPFSFWICVTQPTSLTRASESRYSEEQMNWVAVEGTFALDSISQATQISLFIFPPLKNQCKGAWKLRNDGVHKSHLIWNLIKVSYSCFIVNPQTHSSAVLLETVNLADK
jgi:hypothetical protein